MKSVLPGTDHASVVFVEFTVPDGFHGIPTLPLIVGTLRSVGVPTRWLRFGMEPDSRVSSIGPGVELSADRTDTLAVIIEESAATHVVFSQAPSRGLIEAVGRAGPSAAIAFFDLSTTVDPEGPGGNAGRCFRSADVGGIVGWVLPSSRDEGANGLYSHVSFDFERPGEAGPKVEENVVFVCGRSCSWRGRTGSTPFFDGIEGVESWRGCTFCTGRRAFETCFEEMKGTEPGELLRLHVKALERDLPDVKARCRVLSAAIEERPSLLADALDGVATRPLTLLMEYRADRLVVKASELVETAGKIASEGHVIEICLVGIESFSSDQLDRYVKGFGPEVGIRAVRTLLEAASGSDGALRVKDSTALSTILFDPWSSPGDVAVTLAVVRHLGIADKCRNLPGSRLRLYEGLPLTSAARRDGLLLDRPHDDMLLDTSRRTFYPDEIPWRFEDPRVEAVGSLSVRCAPSSSGPDALGRKVLGFSGDDEVERIKLIERSCLAASGREDPMDPGALLELAGPPPQDPLPCEWKTPASPTDAADVFVPMQHYLDFAFFEAGLKPVMKLEEPFGRKTLDDRLGQIGSAWPSATVSHRKPAWGGGKVVEIFVGMDPSAVESAGRVAAYLDTAPDSRERKAAEIAMAGLLGYPKCCAREYARPSGHPTTGEFEWTRLARHVEWNAEVPPFHQFLVGWIPCSAACSTTKEAVDRVLRSKRAARWLDAFAEQYRAPGSKGSWRDWGDCPALMSMSRPGEFALVTPLDASSDRFRYKTEAVYMSDPRREAVVRGDTLVVEPGLVRVLSGNVEIAFFALDAWLWRRDEPVHAEFWMECIRSAGVGDAGRKRGHARPHRHFGKAPTVNVRS